MFEIEAYHEVSGPQTCKLVMASLVEELKLSNISYSHYDLDSNKFLPTADLLRKQLGVENAGNSTTIHLPLFLSLFMIYASNVDSGNFRAIFIDVS